MAREIINQIECGFCHKIFNVATEDLEWEHITDVGEREDNPGLHDYAISQKVTCPHCGKANDILYRSIGRSSTDIVSQEVMSMEPSVLLK